MNFNVIINFKFHIQNVLYCIRSEKYGCFLPEKAALLSMGCVKLHVSRTPGLEGGGHSPWIGVALFLKQKKAMFLCHRQIVKLYVICSREKNRTNTSHKLYDVSFHSFYGLWLEVTECHMPSHREC